MLRRAQVRAEINDKLLHTALPRFTSKASQELEALPVRGKEEIRQFFHGKYLDVQGFISHITSNSFRERLGQCGNDTHAR